MRETLSLLTGGKPLELIGFGAIISSARSGDADCNVGAAPSLILVQPANCGAIGDSSKPALSGTSEASCMGRLKLEVVRGVVALLATGGL